jgi:hypothetical protein
MGDFQCSRCNTNFGTYYELRDHTAASHKEELAEKMIRARKAL